MKMIFQQHTATNFANYTTAFISHFGVSLDFFYSRERFDFSSMGAATSLYFNDGKDVQSRPRRRLLYASVSPAPPPGLCI